MGNLDTPADGIRVGGVGSAALERLRRTVEEAARSGIAPAHVAGLEDDAREELDRVAGGAAVSDGVLHRLVVGGDADSGATSVWELR